MNTYKQHKLNTIGGLVLNEDDIEQCFCTIFGTEKGKVPHSPNLGLKILKFVDRPINEITAELKAELIKELNLQEPRAVTTKIEFITTKKSPAKLTIKHSYKIKNINEIKTVERQI